MDAYLSVAIPSSSLENEHSLRDKSITISKFARAFSIFGVKNVFIYVDRKTFPFRSHTSRNKKNKFDPNVVTNESKLLKLLLEYLDTPQYLRRSLYPIRNELKYAGILDPIRSPHHKKKIRMDQIKEGDVRIGILNNSHSDKDFPKFMDKNEGTKLYDKKRKVSAIYSSNNSKTEFQSSINISRTNMYVDIGLDYLIPFYGKGNFVGQKVNVKLLGKYPNIKALQASNKDLESLYWGYKVSIVPSLNHILCQDNKNTLVLLTSRKGRPFKATERKFKDLLKRCNNLLIIFGSPAKGLEELYPGIENLAKEKSFFYSNLFHHGGGRLQSPRPALVDRRAGLGAAPFDCRYCGQDHSGVAAAPESHMAGSCCSRYPDVPAIVVDHRRGRNRRKARSYR